MTRVIQKWFRRVDIFPEVVNLMGPEAKTAWRVAYRDAKEYSQISCNALDELVNFRGFGVLKRIWAKNTCIGRIRVNDLRNFNDNAKINGIDLVDFNPNRLLTN